MVSTRMSAEAIAAARRSLTPLAPLTVELAPSDLETGYRIQDDLHQLLSMDQGPLVGYKIGCTSDVMQKYLSIAHPCSGGIFASRVHKSGASLRADSYVRVGVECEIAVRLGRDLTPSQRPFTADAVGGAIEAYYPAIEIVEDRYVEWQTLGAPTLVADDFFAAGIVLGELVPKGAVPNLLDVHGRALINGKEVGRGTGADLLGHPHNALAWLANHSAAQDKSLLRGQIVMTGSLVQTVWLAAGDVARMEFSNLGAVDLTIA
jgi:2-keto-4-pentenoate hydratase